MKQTWAHALLLALFAFTGFWLNSWAVPLFDLDEGAFTEATREMFARGDFLMTYLDGAPRYDKPILVYWLQAASVGVFGFSEFALRLPSLLAASAWMWATYRFVRYLGGTQPQAPQQAPQQALFAAGALALSPVPGLIGHAATADALLNLWIALSLLDGWRYLATTADTPPQRWLLPRIYLWIGLGLLTKGPIAAALPAMVLLPWMAVTRQWRPVWKAATFWPGWLIVLAVVLPWAVTLSLRDGGDFFKHFLLDHNVGRYSQTMESHGGKLWYYVALLPLIVLPFAAWLPATFASLKLCRSSPLHSYLWLWFGVVFVLFSSSATQLPHYLLYGCTPLFVLMGLNAQRLQSRLWALLPSGLFVLLLAALPHFLPHVLPPERRLYDRALLQAVQAALSPSYQAGFAAALAVVLVLAWQRRLTAPQAALRAGLVVAAATWGGVLPLLAAGQQRPVQQAALFARSLPAPVVGYRIHMPSFSVYRGAVTPQRLPVDGEYVFTRIDRLASLAKDTGLAPVEVFRSAGITVQKMQASLPLITAPALPK